jgi:plastocyanin
VKVGVTVTWTNQDVVMHMATLRSGMRASGLPQQGQSFS